jgi:Nucleotidyl transferase AbiEii toxin, Type IV TA system
MNFKPSFEGLPEPQKLLWDKLAQRPWPQPFYLAGGTALALHLGHRQSVDFDFFLPEEMNTHEIIENLRTLGTFELFHQSHHTLHGLLEQVRISFFTYQYPLLEELHPYLNLAIADLLDIALMKLEAIAGRGNKKDFIDLYFLLPYFSLTELFAQYPLKYGKPLNNHYHLLKSLVYFKDAELQPMPVMLVNLSWERVKQCIIAEVKKIKLI